MSRKLTAPWRLWDPSLAVPWRLNAYPLYVHGAYLKIELQPETLCVIIQCFSELVESSDVNHNFSVIVLYRYTYFEANRCGVNFGYFNPVNSI